MFYITSSYFVYFLDKDTLSQVMSIDEINEINEINENKSQPDIDNEIDQDSDNDNDNDSNNNSNSSDDDQSSKRKLKKKYKKLRKKRASIKNNIKYFNQQQVHDTWYQSHFLLKYLPVIKGTLEYDYVLKLAANHGRDKPKVILKKNNKDLVDYSFFYPGSLPFKLSVTRDNLPIECVQQVETVQELFLFSDNLLKS